MGWLYLCRTQSFDSSALVDLMKMPKKYKTWCSILNWWLFHTGSIISIQVFTENFKIVNNLCIGFFALLANCIVTLFPTLDTIINTQLWLSYRCCIRTIREHIRLYIFGFIVYIDDAQKIGKLNAPNFNGLEIAWKAWKERSTRSKVTEVN